MNLQNLTIKTQEAIAQAQQIAVQNQNQQIEDGHIFQAIVETDENVIPYLIKKLGANFAKIEEEIKALIQSYPKVSGGNEQTYLSRAGNEVIQKSLTIAEKMGDEYVSLEHLLMAIVDSGEPTGKILKSNGVSAKELALAVSGEAGFFELARDRFV